MGNYWHGNDGSAEATTLGSNTTIQAWQVTKRAPKVDVSGFNTSANKLTAVELGRYEAIGTVTFKIRHDVAVPDLGIAVLTLKSRSTVPYVRFLGSAIFDSLPLSRTRADEADLVEFTFEFFSDWTGPTLVEA